MLSSIAIFGLRGFQLLFSVVVVGLSVNLVKDQVNGNAPTALTFGTFAGAFGILAGLIGIGAVFVDKLNGFIMMIIDAIAAIFFLAGGAVLVSKLKGVDCNAISYVDNRNWDDNELLNGGVAYFGKDKEKLPGYSVVRNAAHMQSRCKQVQADTAFEFMSFIILLAAIAVTFLFMKKGH